MPDDMKLSWGDLLGDVLEALQAGFGRTDVLRVCDGIACVNCVFFDSLACQRTFLTAVNGGNHCSKD